MFEWNPKYNTGVALIDEQHEELFKIASRINALLHDQYTFDKYDKIIVLITELKAYTLYHFKTEESYMQQIRYKQFFSHKVEHNDFIEKINAIDTYHLDESQDDYLKSMLGFVADWIINHILERDKAISHQD